MTDEESYQEYLERIKSKGKEPMSFERFVEIRKEGIKRGEEALKGLFSE